MEEIKRENKLWTSDSLFLRPWLAIPVAGDVVAPRKLTNGGHEGPPSPEEDEEEEPREESMADFLCRIDSSIARSKDHIRGLEGRYDSATLAVFLSTAGGVLLASGYFDTWVVQSQCLQCFAELLLLNVQNTSKIEK